MHDGATPAAFAVEPIDGGIVLAGEIDIAAADAVRAELARCTSAARPVTVDLRDVSFIDSSGIEVLCAARRDAERVGGSVVLRSPSDVVVRVLEVTGLDDLFPIEWSAADGS